MRDRGRLPVTLAAVALAVLAVGVAAGLTGALPFADGADGEAVVEDVRERYENAETYTAEATVTTTNGSATSTQNVSVVRAAPNSSRLTLRDPRGDTVVGTNGTVAWVYDEANDTARVYPLDGNHSSGAVPGNATWNGTHGANRTADWNHSTVNLTRYLAENVTATVVGTETVRGTETTVVRLDPENESREGTTTLWATEDDRLLRLAVRRGANVTTVDLFDQRFNVSVHESTFQPPSDAAVTVAVNERYDTFAAAQANTSITLVSLDRAGYEFVAAATVTRGATTVTTQRYVRENATTGENTTVALVATADSLPGDSENATTVTVAGENATYVERDGGGFVYWTDDGVTRGVAADLSREDLFDLASDVRS